MRPVQLLSLIAVAICCFSCSGPSDADASDTKPVEHTLAGSFIAAKLQHPVLEPDQMYFRPDGERDAEWIAIVPKSLAARVRIDVPVRITCSVEEVDLEGEPGTKRAYRGMKLLVSKVRYGNE